MVQYNGLIDLIVPVYNESDEHLIRLLSSVVTQDLVKDIYVTLVDDGSDEGYDYTHIVDRFSDLLNIQVLRNPINGGCGVARQYGLDRTSNEYFIIADADDAFQSVFAFTMLKRGLEQINDKGYPYVACIANFYELHDDGTDIKFLSHDRNLVWMHGKMYRREFIENNGIVFHNSSRANEDMGYNTIVHLLSDDEHPINYISMPLYFWLDNPKSITRRDDCSYSVSDDTESSFYGFIENKIYSMKFVRNVNKFCANLSIEAGNSILFIYEQYINTLKTYPEFAEKKYEYSVWFYKEIFHYYETSLPVRMKLQTYQIKQDRIYEKLPITEAPPFTIQEFIDMLKQDSEREGDNNVKD